MFQENLAAKSSPVGTFTAFIGGGVQTYAQFDVIVFPSTLYNTGEYSVTTGIFTVPVTGVYAFHVSLGSCSAVNPTYSNMVARLRGASELGFISTGGDESTGYLTRDIGSATIVAEVQTGEEIRLDAFQVSGGTYCLYGDRNFGYNYFTGFLIQTNI